MFERFAKGFVKGALVGAIAGLVVAGVLFGLVATGAVAATGSLAAIHSFVTVGGSFSPFSVVAFSTIFSAATTAVVSAAGVSTAPVDNALATMAEARMRHHKRQLAALDTLRDVPQHSGEHSGFAERVRNERVSAAELKR